MVRHDGLLSLTINPIRSRTEPCQEKLRLPCLETSSGSRRGPKITTPKSWQNSAHFGLVGVPWDRSAKTETAEIGQDPLINNQTKQVGDRPHFRDLGVTSRTAGSVSGTRPLQIILKPKLPSALVRQMVDDHNFRPQVWQDSHSISHCVNLHR